MAEREAAGLVHSLAEAGQTLVLAESCTAGLAASLIAEVPGASNVLWGSYVTYTVDAKHTMIAVDKALIERYGAVSGETALAMADGALEHSAASIAVSVTGLAGPDGDGSAVPVGTVWIGLAARENNKKKVFHSVESFHFNGSRNEVRRAAALELIAIVKRYTENIHGVIEKR
ncbi:competence damage-inducible protein A [Spirochaetia bacterium]|nr:competence damage-inducible protein A [Spirochaetia bacterium]